MLVVLAFGSGGLGVMSRGGEDLIHFASVCLWSALALGLAATALEGLAVKQLKGQPGSGAAWFALISAVLVLAMGGGLELFVLSFALMGEFDGKAQAEEKLPSTPTCT